MILMRNTFKKLTLAAFAALFMLTFSSLAFGQTTIVGWNFPNNPDDAVADVGTPANSTRTISTIGGTSAVDFTVSGATTNSANATIWTAGSGTKYWRVSFSTVGFSSLAISSKQRSSNTGPRDFKIQYSLDDVNYIDVPNAAITVGNDFTTGVANALPLPAAVNEQPNVYLRWIMTSNTSVNNTTVANAGTSRIDDILVSNVTTAATAEVGGRVVDANGRGLSRVSVTLAGGSTRQVTVLTNGFGYYNFPEVPVGETYVMTVASKIYTFNEPTVVFTVNENLTNVNFIGYR